MAKKNNDDNLIEGHEYDGIRELDNKLPPWWLYLFYFTIIWGVVYLLYYHVVGIGDSSFEEYMKEIDPQWTEVRASTSFHVGYKSPFYSPENDLTPLQRERIEKELAEAEAIRVADLKTDRNDAAGDMSFDDLIISAMRLATPENQQKLKQAFPELFNQFQSQMSGADKEKIAVTSEPEKEIVIEPLKDNARLAAGKNLYEINCATCHGKLGEGGIGPNLADEYFIHGSGMTNTVRIIQQGVAAKGMIAWRGILQEDQIIQVSSYVVRLYGTNPPNAKAPQGDKVSIAIVK